MRAVWRGLLLGTLLVSVAACDDWFELFDGDYYDADCPCGSSSSSSGSSTSTRTLWRCPESLSFAEEAPAAFSDAVLSSPDGTDLFAGAQALYARILSGPNAAWQAEGLDFDHYEYYFFGLSGGGALVLRLVEQLPGEDENGFVTGSYFVYDAGSAPDFAALEEDFSSLAAEDGVLDGLDVETAYGDAAETGAFEAALTDFGDRTYSYAAELETTGLSQTLPAAVYALSFAVATESRLYEFGFRDAYAVEKRSSGGGASDYSLTVYVDGAVADSAVTEGQDVAGFADLCGPSGDFDNPVIF